MSKFVYKFEAVKKVKLTFEKLIQKEVAEIELKIKAQNEELVLLQDEKISEKNRIIQISQLSLCLQMFLKRILNKQ